MIPFSTVLITYNFRGLPILSCVLFPQELMDLFVDEASDDIMALWSSSLMSCSFLPRTRVYLFKTIGICTIAKCQKFHELCITSPYPIHYVKELRVSSHSGCTLPVFGDTYFPA